MWEIRITDVSDLQVTDFCKYIGGKSLAIREGPQMGDDDPRDHVHIYSIETKSESAIRKKIQSLDPTRKGNDLYSLSPAHINTPNYILKRVFEETDGKFETTITHKRIVYNTENFLEHNYGKWFTQHEDYLKTIRKEKLIRKKVKKDSTINMLSEIADKYRDEDISNPNHFIEDVIEWHTERDLMLPSRSNMERYIITILNLVKNNPSYMRSYYQIYFQP